MFSCVLVTLFIGGVLAANEVDVHTEIYVVAGVLGGICLILTIVAILNSVTIVSLQGKMTMLQRILAASSPGLEPPLQAAEEKAIRRETRRAGEQMENFRLERYSGPYYPEDRRYGAGHAPPSARTNQRQDYRSDGYY